MTTIRSVLGGTLVAATLASAAQSAAPGLAATPSARVVSRVAKAQWSPDGTVRAITLSPTRVYIAGDFTHVRNTRSGQQVRRNHVAAFRRDNGALVRGFNPQVNGSVDALAVLKHRLVIGGDFSSVGGRSRQHLAAVNGATGHVAPWVVPVDGPVFTLLTMRGQVYVGGDFEHADGVFRSHLFALDGHGALSSTWPSQSVGTTDHGVYTLAASGNRRAVLVGGSFRSLAGTPRRFLGEIAARSGKVTAWAPRTPCVKGRRARCFVHALTTDGHLVYAGLSGPGGTAVAYRATTGHLAWFDHTTGDVSAVAVDGKNLILGGHFTRVRHHSHTMFAEVVAKTGRVTSRRLTQSGPRYPGVLALSVADRRIRLGGAFLHLSGERRYAVVAR